MTDTEDKNNYYNPHTLKQAQEAMSEGQDNREAVECVIRNNNGIDRLADECEEADQNNTYCVQAKYYKQQRELFPGIYPPDTYEDIEEEIDNEDPPEEYPHIFNPLLEGAL